MKSHQHWSSCDIGIASTSPQYNIPGTVTWKCKYIISPALRLKWLMWDMSINPLMPTLVSLVCHTKHLPLCHTHDDVIKWKHFPRYWPFVREIHRSPVNFPHKGQWRGALMFTLICARMNGWVNDHEAGDLRRYLVHYDVIVMHVVCIQKLMPTIGVFFFFFILRTEWMMSMPGLVHLSVHLSTCTYSTSCQFDKADLSSVFVLERRWMAIINVIWALKIKIFGNLEL